MQYNVLFFLEGVELLFYEHLYKYTTYFPPVAMNNLS